MVVSTDFPSLVLKSMREIVFFFEFSTHDRAQKREYLFLKFYLRSIFFQVFRDRPCYEGNFLVAVPRNRFLMFSIFFQSTRAFSCFDQKYIGNTYGRSPLIFIHLVANGKYFFQSTTMQTLHLRRNSYFYQRCLLLKTKYESIF